MTSERSLKVDVIKVYAKNYTWTVPPQKVKTFEESKQIFSYQINNESFMVAPVSSNATENFDFTG